MKISIVIPNFNGEKLLENNLPNILKSRADEVIVCDDGSVDKSLELLSKLRIQSEKLKVIEHKKNQGFIPSVNELFEETIGDIVISLNNDVFVNPNFLETVTPHFEDPNIFAVNLHEEGEGPSVAFWNNGFFEYKRGEEKNIVQKSAWASGGSAAYRKKIWQQLGGFDKGFAPFYWEDVDISFRAIKMGYDIFWEPNSRVKHFHETTINKTFSRKYINYVKERNQLLFIWKNIRDSKLNKDHRSALLKRLFSKIGYFVPFIWALWQLASVRSDKLGEKRSDLEAINYAKQ